MNLNNYFSKLLLLLTFLYVFTSCGKEESPETINLFFVEDKLNVLSYDGIKEEKKTVVFEDQFTNNDFGWPVVTNDNIACEINDGFYYIQTSSAGGWHITNQEIILPSEFEMETSFTFLDSGSFEAGLSWNGQDYFSIGSDGHLAFKSNLNFFSEPLSAAIIVNPVGTPNLITLRKAGPKYYMFINKSLAKIADYSPLEEVKAGFSVNYNSSVRFDFIKVSELNLE